MRLTAIGSREASIFTSLADAFVAPEPPLPAVRDTDALWTFDAWLARSPPVNRVGLRVVLHLFELAPALSGGGRRLRRLDRDHARRWLTRAEHLPLRAPRELTRALKTLILLCYYGDEAVMAGLGYDAEANVRRGRELRRTEGRP